MFTSLTAWISPPQPSPLQVFSGTNITQALLTGDIIVLGNRTYNITGKVILNKTLITSPNTMIIVSGELIIESPLCNLPDNIFCITGTGRVIIQKGDVYANWFTSNGDFSHSLRCAILSVSDWKDHGRGLGRTVRIRNGNYILRSVVGIRDVSIKGDGWDSTILTVDITNTTDATLSQVLERDSITPQRHDGGRSELTGFTLKGTDRNIASGIHVYGDGHLIHRVRVTGMWDAITVELPIMVTVDTCYMHNNKRRGLWCRQANIDGKQPIGTSLLVRNCWAYRCGGSGFRVETLAYSTFENCASQECGYDYDFDDSYGWVIRGNIFGEGVMNKVTFRNIAIEGDAKGMLIENVRGVTLESIKYVWGGYGVNVGPRESLIQIGNASVVLSNIEQGELNPDGVLSGNIVRIGENIIDNRLYAHIGFTPDPNNSNWIYDNTGRDGAISLINSRVVVKPFNQDHLTNNELRRFSTTNSAILNSM